MASWWLRGAVFPPLPAPANWNYPYPKCPRSSVLGVRPVRVERHNPWSIATLRQTIARVLLRQLASCPFVEVGFYNTVELLIYPLTRSPTHPLTHSPLTHLPTYPFTKSPIELLSPALPSPSPAAATSSPLP